MPFLSHLIYQGPLARSHLRATPPRPDKPARYALFPEAGFQNAVPSRLQLFSRQVREARRPRQQWPDCGSAAQEGPDPLPPQSPPGTREPAREAHGGTLAIALLIGCAERRQRAGPVVGGSARLHACADRVRWTKGEVPGRFSRVRHFVAVAIGNGLGATAREARLLLGKAASCDGEGRCWLLRLRSRRIPGQK